MRYRYGVFSLLLFFIVLILGYENYQTWSSAGTPGSRMKAGKLEGKTEAPSGGMAPRKAAPWQAFGVIAEKNVFNPDRQEFPSAGGSVAGAAAAKPVPRPPITLYGVAMAGGYESATIVNPGRPLRKGEREAKTIKVGDMVGEYKLTKILPDRIVMEGGEDSFEVLLYDPLSPKKRLAVITPVQPAKVTSPTSGPTPVGTAPAARPVVIAPAARAPSSSAPRPVTPVPLPRTPTQPPGETYQPQSQPSTPTPLPPVPNPGLWRGRRPNTSGGPSG